MSASFDRTVHLHPAGKPATGQRDSKSKADEALVIEEILKAAGLEALD